MAGTDGDPFDWDVDKVVHELCIADKRPWLPRQASKRPDPQTLSNALRENEIDGETLLTYEDVMSSTKGLLETLGLTKPAHQMTLVKAITYLKSKSAGYRQHKLESAGQELESQNSSQEAPVDNIQQTPLQQGSSPPRSSSDLPRREESVAEQLVGLANTKANGDPKEPPQKRRRLAPVLISTDVAGLGAANFPHAATGVTRHFPRSYSKPDWLDTTSNAYFGTQALITADLVPKSNFVVSEDSTLTQSEINGLAPAGEHVLDLATRGKVPAGKRRQIHRAMSRLFRKNNESLNSLNSGFHPQVEPSDEGDEILPAFGESDDEEYDSDTMREMEEEAEEIRQEKARKSHLLSGDDVDRVMQEEILRMEESWEERKLPLKQRHAKALWNRARRQGLKRAMAQAHARLAGFTNRIEKLCLEMRRNEWHDEDELKKQMRCLEASVEDRKKDRWFLDVLQGPEPPGPESLPRLLLPTAQREVLSDEDGEVITSDDDDGFVIDDMRGIAFTSEPVETRPGTPMDLDNPEQTAEVDQSPLALRQESMAKTSVDPGGHQVIDLTFSESEAAAAPQKVHISLITPTKPRDVRPSTEMDVDEPQTYPDEDLEIPIDRPVDIAAIPPEVWKDHKDRERLLICVLWRVQRKKLQKDVFSIFLRLTSSSVWEDIILPALTDDEGREFFGEVCNLAARLFRVFALCRVQTSGSSITRRITGTKAKKLRAQAALFEPFYDFMREIEPYFVDQNETDADLDDSERLSGDDIEDSPSKRRMKPVVLDQTAKDLRETDQQRLQEQEKRRIELRKKLAASAIIPSDKSRLIINESKQDDQGLIYINEDIGRRIKEHQIQGVRFMWNQIICDPKVRQGCLLAHTMGLGKTMQVITLLVAIAESAQSPDESINSQIPNDLRQSKTLVLCPSLLVDNWLDEMLMWAPEGLLGPYFKLESATKQNERMPIIRRWDDEGGVMIIGYDMFKRLVDEPGEELPKENDGKTAWNILTQSPNLVVADEAHKLKNPDSKIGLAASQFRTQSRIALTGSPLANSVEEYYYMIDWVAPRYLGPPSEFRDLYTRTIQEGLYEDSTRSQFRMAKKQLAVLEKTVAPKAHRATIKSLSKNDLPQKTEFILTVPVTDLQARLYDAYLQSARGDADQQVSSRILGIVSNLGLIVNHPKCWQNKLAQERRLDTSKNPSNRSANLALSPAVVSSGLKMMNRPKVDIQSAVLSWKTRLLVAILAESEKVKDKVLVFTSSIPTMDYLENLLRQQKRKVARLDGSTPINLRQQHIKNFNSGDTQVYLISTTAGGIGLNIYGANRVVLFDFKYNPVNEQQAVGRAYRIGQQKPVFVYKLLSGGTFESAMQNRSVFKTQLASRVVDKENPKRWSKKDNEYLKDRETPPRQDLTHHMGKDSVLDSLLSNPELSQGICDIETTDTFEEHDPDDVLTAEDRKDVEDQVPGANTHFGTHPESIAVLDGQNASAAAIESPKPQAKKAPKKRPFLINWPYQFEQKIMEASQKIKDTELLVRITENPKDIAKRVAHSTWKIREDKKFGEWPNQSHMKALCRLMESPRFAAAILIGHFTPAELALAPSVEALEDMEKALAQLGDREFRERLKLGTDQPEEHNV
ncbi:Protein CHROMATIN REMODELING 20 [Colletotrichum sp. SAR 10_70]|nr:Protein CHROMATIN REMODELING 20 [Colletotrichum sp. SAR 10_71]KAI8161379.1 Protein CHROMATIN REMODELING 20 [Colletotrichum sp. SAR 10_70]KAI8197510.1 Protein CHROMATIN REMODELING 20 [Colletotrichum sp. SAR 10_76]KAI8217088.1 Protein CHROMATIN REMODELING 20 [Colletotrichum sp. SAR 10_86]